MVTSRREDLSVESTGGKKEEKFSYCAAKYAGVTKVEDLRWKVKFKEVLILLEKPDYSWIR